MDNKEYNEWISLIRKSRPEQIAKEIINVQPIDLNFNEFRDHSMSREELINNGYSPVEKDGVSLIWIKNKENE